MLTVEDSSSPATLLSQSMAWYTCDHLELQKYAHHLHGGGAFAILNKAGQTVSKSDCDFIDACRDTHSPDEARDCRLK